MLTIKNMKTIAKLIIVVFLIGSTNTIFANGARTELKIIKENNKAFSIKFEYNKEIDVKVTFKDAREVTLFKEQLKNVKKVYKTFDISNLPNGKYSVVVEDNKTIYSQLIEIKNHKLFYNAEDVTTTNKPVKYVNQDVLYISSVLEKGVDVQITIYNDLDEIVHKETSTTQNNLNKKFKFLDGHPNDYKVVVRYNEITFNLY